MSSKIDGNVENSDRSNIGKGIQSVSIDFSSLPPADQNRLLSIVYGDGLRWDGVVREILKLDEKLTKELKRIDDKIDSRFETLESKIDNLESTTKKRLDEREKFNRQYIHDQDFNHKYILFLSLAVLILIVLLTALLVWQ